MRDIAELMKGYLRYVRPAGDGNIAGPCPYHKGGQEKKPSFYMSTTKGVFFCHACGAKGTLAQFLKSMGAKRDEIDAAMEGIEFEPKEKIERKKLKLTQARLNETILGLFEYCPKDLVKAGFERELLQEYEIGFDKENMRIIFPLRDKYGTLVAIIGRTVVHDGYPRYKCYSSEDLLKFANGDPDLVEMYSNYKINHRAFLWNMHRVFPGAFYDDLKEVVVVEGYKACLWMIQAGYPNSVAIQGSQSTHFQEGVLSSLGATVYLFLDNNMAGQLGTVKSGGRMVDHWGMRVKVCQYPYDAEEGTQPDNLEMEALHSVFDTAISFRTWRAQWIAQNGELLSPSERRSTSRSGRAREAAAED